MKDINLKNKYIIVLGYALTGKSVVEFLLKQHANIILTDRGDLSLDPSVSLLKERGVKVVDNGHPLSLLTKVDMIIKNPGIPYQIPFLIEAKRKNIPIYTDVEVASWVCEADIVAITGSNGKTTTTSLINELLSSKYQSHLVGNIGIPVLDSIEKVKEDDLLIMELSSFQLEGIQKFHPKISVVTNIYPAHLDYHGSLEKYIEAKLKLLKNIKENDIVIYNYDQKDLRNRISEFPGMKIPFAMKDVDNYVVNNGVYLRNQNIYFKNKHIMNINEISLPGDHNIQNVMAALAVAEYYEIPNSTQRKIVNEYKGMPHRIQLIADYHQRKFYNDSKATNAQATATALKAFEGPIVYIGGGLDRGESYDALVPYVDKIEKAFVYGETKEAMETFFKEHRIPVEAFNDLKNATTAAYLAAQKDDIVLFSPSNASWDQFKNFEERGEYFVKLIEKLATTHPY